MNNQIYPAYELTPSYIQFNPCSKESKKEVSIEKSQNFLSFSGCLIREFKKLGLIDEEAMAIPCPGIQSYKLPILSSNETLKINDFLDKNIEINNRAFPFIFLISPRKILSSIQEKLFNYQTKIEIVGGAVSYLLGSSYFQRAINLMNGCENLQIPDEMTKQINREPVDFDIRIYVEMGNNESDFWKINDVIFEVLADALKQSNLIGAQDICGYLMKLNSARFGFLTPDHPKLFTYFVKQSMSAKMNETWGTEINYSVVGLGNPRIEFILIQRTKRTHMFTRDALRLSVRKIHDNKDTEVNIVYDESISPFQYLLDRLCNIVHIPDRQLTTSEDFAVISSLRTKYGSISLNEKDEIYLLDKFLRDASTKDQIQKILYSAYKKAIKNHHKHDPLHALCWIFNSCQSLQIKNEKHFLDMIWMSFFENPKENIQNLNNQIKDPLIDYMLKAIQYKLSFEQICSGLQVYVFFDLINPHLKSFSVSFSNDRSRDVIDVKFGKEFPCFLSLNFDLIKAFDLLENNILFNRDICTNCEEVLPSIYFGNFQSLSFASELNQRGLIIEDLYKIFQKFQKSDSPILQHLSFQLLFACHAMDPQMKYVLDMLELFPKAIRLDCNYDILICNLKLALEKSKMAYLLKNEAFISFINEKPKTLELYVWKWMGLFADIGDPILYKYVYLYMEELAKDQNSKNDWITYGGGVVQKFLISNRDMAVNVLGKYWDRISKSQSLELMMALFLPLKNFGAKDLNDLQFFANKAIHLLPEKKPVNKKKTKILDFPTEKFVAYLEILFVNTEFEQADQLFQSSIEKGLIVYSETERSKLILNRFIAFWKKQGTLAAFDWLQDQEFSKIWNSNCVENWLEITFLLTESLLNISEYEKCESLLRNLWNSKHTITQAKLVELTFNFLEFSNSHIPQNFSISLFYINKLSLTELESERFHKLLKIYLMNDIAPNTILELYPFVNNIELINKLFLNKKELSSYVALFTNCMFEAKHTEKILEIWKQHPFCLEHNLSSFCKMIVENKDKDQIISAYKCLKSFQIVAPAKLNKIYLEAWTIILEGISKTSFIDLLSFIENPNSIDTFFGSHYSQNKINAWISIISGFAKNQKYYDENLWSKVFKIRGPVADYIADQNHLLEKIDIPLVKWISTSKDLTKYIFGLYLARMMISVRVEKKLEISEELLNLIDHLLDTSRQFLSDNQAILVFQQLLELVTSYKENFQGLETNIFKSCKLILEKPHHILLQHFAYNSIVELLSIEKEVETKKIEKILEVIIATGNSNLLISCMKDISLNPFKFSHHQQMKWMKNTFEKYFELNHQVGWDMCLNDLNLVGTFAKCLDLSFPIITNNVEKIFNKIISYLDQNPNYFSDLITNIFKPILMDIFFNIKINDSNAYTNDAQVWVKFFKVFVQNKSLSHEFRMALIINFTKWIHAKLSNNFSQIQIEFFLELIEEMIFSIPLSMDNEEYESVRFQMAQWIAILNFKKYTYEGNAAIKWQNIVMYLSNDYTTEKINGEEFFRVIRRFMVSKGGGNIYTSLVLLSKRIETISWKSERELFAVINSILDNAKDHSFTKAQNCISILSFIPPALTKKSPFIIICNKTYRIISEKIFDQILNHQFNNGYQLLKTGKMEPHIIKEIVLTMNFGVYSFGMRGRMGLDSVEKLFPLAIDVIKKNDLEILSDMNKFLIFIYERDQKIDKLSLCFTYHSWIRQLLELFPQLKIEMQADVLIKIKEFVNLALDNKIYCDQTKKKFLQVMEMIQIAESKNKTYK